MRSPSGAARRTGGRPDVPAPRLAQGISTTVISGFGIITLLNVRNGVSGGLLLGLCVAAVLVLYGVQFTVAAPGARDWSPRRRGFALVALTLLTYVPMFWFGVAWGSMAGPLGGSILLLLPARLAWPGYGIVVLSLLGWSAADHVSALETGYFTVSTALTGLVIFGLTRLTDLVREVHAARAEMARMAVTQERLRFARDLHDLLGYSLSTITLKSELIHRLIPANPDRACEEVAGVLGVSRQALADVRLVASGYREMSLESEAASVADVMAAADVRVDMDIACGRLHPVVDTVLATALREGVTNILRHSKVQSCTIRAVTEGERVRLTLLNDGVTARRGPMAADASGSGLGNLRTRLGGIDGCLSVSTDEDGWFRLVAEAPVRPVTADGSAVRATGAAAA
ncbi:histidine kinase [Streptomyces sp. SID5785]|uniref:sensor histidine kinase n=1 Tax=Streptomyces sp. SID5785 TaxID=2690309 RepID=UPI001360BA5D|nr:histidine kinase [Streptomyces sp. SID5785]MZD07809.1 histidine kinase [Streptomyces sp. SID5785]